jgi:aromatic ring-opening dioxygenase LigB subunit
MIATRSEIGIVANVNDMTWLNFDLFKFEGQMFQDSLNHRVREAYLAAYSVLEKANGERQEELYKQLNSITEDVDGEQRALTEEVIGYEEIRWLEQREALAAMAIALLASLNKSFLDAQKRMLNKTHPLEKDYKGKRHLFRQIAEYNDRFKIDLTTVEGFETVREIELARNCCLHEGGSPDENYKTQTKQRFLDAHGIINLTPEQLDSIIGELSQFGKTLTARMSDVRKNTSQDSTAGTNAT